MRMVRSLWRLERVLVLVLAGGALSLTAACGGGDEGATAPAAGETLLSVRTDPGEKRLAGVALVGHRGDAGKCRTRYRSRARLAAGLAWHVACFRLRCGWRTGC